MNYDELVSVNSIVNDALKKSRLLKQGMIQGNWSKIVGKELAKKSYVAMLKNSVLIVYTENSVWLQQFNFMKKDLICRINEYLKMDYISDIQFKVSKMNIEDYFKEVEEEKEFHPEEVFLERGSEEKAEEVVAEIEDEEIRNRIKKLMILSKKREKFLLEEEGNKKCIDCGVIFKGKGIRCTVCENKLRKMKLELIYNIISSNPQARYEDVKPVLKDFRETEFEDIRENIKKRAYRLMHKALNMDDIDKYKEYARIFFVLETGISEEKEIDFMIKQYLERLE